MDYKPVDLFVGVVEFFSILLPGAFLTFMVAHLVSHQLLDVFPELTNSTVAWAAFVFASYFLGHVVYGLAALPLNYLYAKTYRRWSGPDVKILETKAKSIATALVTMRGDEPAGQKPTEAPKKTGAAQVSRKASAELSKLAGKAPASVDVMFEAQDSVLPLATAIVRLRAPSGVTEIDRSEADSKFFRSIAPVLLFTGIVFFFVPASSSFSVLQKEAVISGCFLTLALSLWRFMDLRHRLIKLTYELLIALVKSDVDHV